MNKVILIGLFVLMPHAVMASDKKEHVEDSDKKIASDVQRYQNYLIRTCTARCLGMPEEPPFKVDPTEEEECKELLGTVKASLVWLENPNIAACAQREMNKTLNPDDDPDAKGWIKRGVSFN